MGLTLESKHVRSVCNHPVCSQVIRIIEMGRADSAFVCFMHVVFVSECYCAHLSHRFLQKTVFFTSCYYVMVLVTYKEENFFWEY